MTYVRPNYPTKKALRDALAAGVPVEVFEPAIGSVPADGIVWLEGPWAPAHHTWYAEGRMVAGKLVKVK